MAIQKTCTNLKVRVQKDYQRSVTGNIQKIASKINVEARIGNLILACNKKVVGQGGKSS